MTKTIATANPLAPQFTKDGLEIPQFAIDLAETRPNTTPEEAWEVFGYYSDTHKDLWGSRPRNPLFFPKTLDAMEKDTTRMNDEANEAYEAEMGMETARKARLVKEKEELNARLEEEHERARNAGSIGNIFPDL